ncbi:lambda exonuclease family protein [uncultured Paraglaciecola sp.]|uniref:lambda exonuclease family protein n=1 Tax=uncultured Paraglaciecola sp. TaxID=1765024 RepID=UPI00260FBC53|nr:lambda exonuclease family protein [uncultured Paraglaciecola sp.]
MIVDSSPQGSEGWFAARSGIPTASAFNKIITSTGKSSDQRMTYMRTLLAERIAGPRENALDGMHYIERGKELEPEARSWYEMAKGVLIEVPGLCYRNEQREEGASPDGLVGDDGSLEIKCPKDSTHISYMEKAALPSTYLPQVQGQLYVTGRKWCDFLSYHPDLPPVCVRVERDEKFILTLAMMLQKFNAQLSEKHQQLREQYNLK